MRQGDFKKNILGGVILYRILLWFLIWLLFMINGFTSDLAQLLACISAPITALITVIAVLLIPKWRYIPKGNRMFKKTWSFWLMLVGLIIILQIALLLLSGFFGMLTVEVLFMGFTFFECMFAAYLVILSTTLLSLKE